jgi:hypothetical protein
LKYIGKFSPPGLPKGGVGAGEEVGAVLPKDLAIQMTSRRWGSEAGEGECRRGFSRPALSDDGDGFARGNGEGKILHGSNGFGAGGKSD